MTPEQGNRIVGSLRRVDGVTGAIRVEDLYDTDIDDLWSALTDPRRLARWLATVEGDLRLGGWIQVCSPAAPGDGGVSTLASLMMRADRHKFKY